VRYVITFIMQLWLFTTPVLYPIAMIPAKWHLLYAINPMAGMVSGFRASVLGGPFPIDVILVSIVSAAVLFTAAVRYFVQVERRFADVI
jgi:lipopolysaccharide transport system permease protein